MAKPAEVGEETDTKSEGKTRITAAREGGRQWLPFKHRLWGGGRGTAGAARDVGRLVSVRRIERLRPLLKWLFFAFEGEGRKGDTPSHCPTPLVPLRLPPLT